MSTQTLKDVGSLCFLFKLVMISPEHAAPNLSGFRPSVRDSRDCALRFDVVCLSTAGDKRSAVNGQDDSVSLFAARRTRVSVFSQ